MMTAHFHRARAVAVCVRLSACLLLAAPASPGGRAEAQAPKIDKATLQKVKQATVLVTARLPDGSISQGSGFLAFEPGLVITNAHVLGMLEPTSRPPTALVVRLDSGLPGSRVLKATVLGTDRGQDLAVLKVAGKALPAPLKLGATDALTETQDVYVFGFPFARTIGNNITVTKSTISSLRTARNGSLLRIQTNGGMHPGNSGGPVTNAEGEVIGVAVSVIEGTTINFAIAANLVVAFLNGRLDTVSRGPAHRDERHTAMEVVVRFVDPLQRVRTVKLETWTGKPGPIRPASATEPKPAEGDSRIRTVELTYDRKALARGGMELPPLPNPKDVYWARAVYTDHTGKTIWGFAFGQPIHMLVESRPTTLEFKPAVGKLGTLELLSKSQLKVRDQSGEQFSLRSNVHVRLREKAAKVGSSFSFNQRYYSVGLGVFVNDKLVKGNAEIAAALKSLFKFASHDIKLGPTGKLEGIAMDISKAPKDHYDLLDDITDQVAHALLVLVAPLPSGALKPRQTWADERVVAVGPLGGAIPARARLTYKYEGMRVRNGKTEAVIGVEGALTGIGKAQAGLAGTVNGLLFVLQETGEVAQANVSLKVDIDLRLRGRPVRATGELSANLRRPATPVVKKKK
jgi:hypothetical protein